MPFHMQNHLRIELEIQHIFEFNVLDCYFSMNVDQKFTMRKSESDNSLQRLTSELKRQPLPGSCK